MRVVSLFSGCGGFDLGLERAGMEVVLQCEIGKWQCAVLRRWWPGVTLVNDVRDIEEVEADVIAGGFPCQDVSIAGLRRGLSGERSGLWFEFERITRESRPRWVIIENVPGLLVSHGRRDFGRILRALDECGYGVAWRVLDSQYFGVPQRRRRVFIVGYLGGWRGAAAALFEPEGCSGVTSPAEAVTAWEAGEGIGAAEGSAGRAGALVAPTVVTKDIGCKWPNFGSLGTIDVIMAAGEKRPRRFTPLECERLQGFPGGWTAYGSDGMEVPQMVRYEMLGNAVTVPVAEWIGRNIMRFEELGLGDEPGVDIAGYGGVQASLW